MLNSRNAFYNLMQQGFARSAPGAAGAGYAGIPNAGPRTIAQPPIHAAPVHVQRPAYNPAQAAPYHPAAQGQAGAPQNFGSPFAVNPQPFNGNVGISGHFGGGNNIPQHPGGGFGGGLMGMGGGGMQQQPVWGNGQTTSAWNPPINIWGARTR